MKITSIGIIGGTNGIGRSFADFFQKKFGKDKEILVSGRKTEITNKKIVQKCDLVIFSVPIEVTESVISEMVPFSRSDQIWMDFTSIKEGPVGAMLQSKAKVCGAHPMFAPTKFLVGEKVILTPVRISDEDLMAVKEIFSDFQLLFSTPEDHDVVMGVVQGLSHLSDLVMGAALASMEVDFQKVLDFASPPYALKLDMMGRMFEQNPHLYASIATQNPQMSHTTQKFSESLGRIFDLIKEKDTKTLVSEFETVQKFLGEDFTSQAFENSEKWLRKQYHLQDIASKSVEKGDIAIFGEEDSHTDIASFDFSERKESSEIIHCQTIFETFQLVEDGKVRSAVVPLENSIEGSVFETLDELFRFPDVSIVEGVEKDIHQHLLGLPGASLDQIQCVCSHSQALSQSQDWIRSNLMGVSLQKELSTTIAAKKVCEGGDFSIAAVGSEEVSEKLGLQILARNIEGFENRTKFVLIKKEKPAQETNITSLVFWFLADKAGNLAEVLDFLSHEKINLTKIDSRRAGKAFGGFLFFVDIEFSVGEFEQKLPEFEKLVGGVRALGGY